MPRNPLFVARHFLIVLLLVFVSVLEAQVPVLANQSVKPLNLGLAIESPVVTGDDEVDAFIGTGGLLLPSSFSGSQVNRQALAGCLDCVWRFSIYCAQDSQAMCAHAATTCPVGKIRYRVKFSKSGEAPITIGSICWGSSKPVTREKIGIDIAQKFVRYLPELKLGISPAPQTLTMVPIIVWCGQKPEIKLPEFTISGFKVTVIASATWLWTWGDGTNAWTRVPGRRFPSTQLTHQFKKSGAYNVSVKSHWSGHYLIHGVGKFPTIGEPVTQYASQKISVVDQDSRLSQFRPRTK